MKKKAEKKVVKEVVKKPKVKMVIAEENTPIIVDIDMAICTATTSEIAEVKGPNIPPQSTTFLPEGTVSWNAPRKTYFYPIPETREDYLALHKCLKDLGVNSIGDLEVRASKL